MLDWKLCSVIYLKQVTYLLSLHLKIPKPGKDWRPLAETYIGDGPPTSSCSSTMALPCWDSTTFLEQFTSPSLGEPTRAMGYPSLSLEWVTTRISLNLCFMLVLCFYA